MHFWKNAHPIGLRQPNLRKMMFNKILIANRGEIACRIIRTLNRLGIQAVAIYSDEDRDALHVKMADEAHHIGASTSLESYLNIDAVLSAAKKSGANAIHPGYGFLSENAEFAEQCAAAGIVFIGPQPTAIRAMGEKDTAKKIMEKANIPVIPGYHGEDQSPAALLTQAKKMGYPVLIKAVAGGGGKGMRVVHCSEEFLEALNSAKREAKSSFKNDRVLLEKYISRPRHIEVQVFADRHGNTLHLFERDCSIQRRHQKVIEEATAPNISDEMRKQLGETAVTAAKAIHYEGAGTIEFLYDSSHQRFYFMEMNTRLQVEHPVTEMITGIDLVEWQIRVAAGEKLPITQDQLTFHGHAIETRIYAEDPTKDFLPSTGRLLYFKTPEQNLHIRIDEGVAQNNQISIYYDPMIAKLIVWGETREIAINYLKQALEQFYIVGVATNIALLHAIINHPAFAQADLSTDFIEQFQEALLPKVETPSADIHALGAISFLLLQQRKTHQLAAAVPDCSSPWFMTDSFRMNSRSHQLVRLWDGHQWLMISVSALFKGYQIDVNNQRFEINAHFESNDIICATMNHQTIRLCVLLINDVLHLFHQGKHFSFQLPSAEASASHVGDHANHLISPMPGTIINIHVNAGQKVQKGDRLIVIEAMKMEHTLYAPDNGIVTDVFYNAGDMINEGVELLTFEAIESISSTN